MRYFLLMSFTIWLMISLVSNAQDVSTNDYVIFYHPNGKISSEGLMINGKPEGYWKTYDITGVLVSEGKRNSHLLDSVWTFYNNLGQVSQKISYMYGKKNGYSISYEYNKYNADVDTGIIRSKELYIDDKKEGLSYYYYDTGKLKSEVSYVNGKMQGLARIYDNKGILTSLIQYHNGYITDREDINRTDNEGLKQGIWREYYADGRVKLEKSYKNDQLNGLYKEFNNKGQLVLVLRYENGNLSQNNILEEENVDVREVFDNENLLIESGSYRNEIPIGIHRKYDKEGKVISSVIYNEFGKKVSEGIVDEEGKKTGIWRDFYLTGEIQAEGIYANNQRTGSWNFYFRNKRIEQTGKYINGRADGLWRWFYEDGTLEREEYFFNGREDGPVAEYLNTGTLITSGEYVEGEKEGYWFYKVGDQIEEGNYINGLRDGNWKYFYADSTLKFEGNYIQGNLDGKHKLYYKNGSLKEERYYVMGIKEKTWKKYDEEGNIIMTISYKNDQESRVNGVKVNLPERNITLIR